MNKSRFVWHDLNVMDVEAARRFYGEAFNWSFEDGGGKDPYVHIKAGDQQIGGIRRSGKASKVPSHWLGYIGVDDVAATVDKIVTAGGKVQLPTTQIDKVGTFAVTSDPNGAMFSPWKSARAGDDQEPAGPPRNGTFCWDELVATDPDAAERFYVSVFGWGAQKRDMGPAGVYTQFFRPGTSGGHNGQPSGAGGMMKAPPGVPHSYWVPYVTTADVDALNAKAKRLGATIMVPPTDIPSMGRFSCWSDPQGAAIAVIAFTR
jgi:predicted enzyme related to lactoylglutathione lyase